MKKIFTLILLALLPMLASAYDACIDGIYYNFFGGEATVTSGDTQYNSYSGTVVIPSSVYYYGTTYSVTSIGEDAFSGCSSLTSVTIGNSVTSIGYGAFSYCSSLTSVTIGNGVTSIGESAFKGTGWYNAQPDGILYLDNWLIGYKGTKPTGNVTINSGTRGIANSAFRGCSGLTSITIPNSVTSIGSSAFSGCSGLTSVTIPDSVTSIGSSAFSGTGWYNAQPDGILYLDNWLIGYKGAKPTGDVIINSGTKWIADHAFSNCSSLTSVTIPNSVTSIGRYAFSWCSSLTSVTIPESVTSIGEDAFSGCSSLTSVTIGNGVTSIGEDAFSNCYSLTSVTIGNSVTSIGRYAFSWCESLTSVNIPESVTSIGYYAFEGCSGLTSVTIGNGVTSIGSSAFSNCTGLTSVTIGNGVTSIGIYAFYNCSSLTSVTIPESVTSIGDYAFLNCSGLTSVTIGNGVTSIGNYAFEGCSSLTSVTIPNSVTSIGNGAFRYCSGLTSVTIGNSVTSIGDEAFYGCSSLTSVTIGNSVTSIGDWAFSYCSGLTSVTIPNSVTSIGRYAFSYCTSLTSITIPNNVTSIGERAFSNCSGLTDVWCYAEYVPTTDSDAFYYSSIGSATLHVPAGSVNSYKTTSPWSRFGTIVAIQKTTYTLTYIVDGEVYKTYEIDEGTAITPEPEPTKAGYTFSGWSEIPETMPAHDVTVTGSFTKDKLGKCATPTISYVDGKLKFSCETEGVLFNPTIKDDDIKTYNHTDEIDLCVTYHISVYAQKEDYYDSEVATATLCWIDVEPRTEGIVNEDAVTEVKALPVLIQTQGGNITIQGTAEGTPIAIYDTSGKQYGSALSEKDCTTISTTLQSGTIAIVKIGEKAIKIAIK